MARRRGLTPEDRALWSRVTRGTVPLHPRDRVPLTAARSSSKMPENEPPPRSGNAQPQPQVGLPLGDFRIGQAVPSGAAGGKRLDPAPSPAQALASGGLRMDAKTHRRMVGGKLRPEARLDLHGMTLAAAHPALIGFVTSCRAAGLRLVLVITGKGRGDHGPLPTRPGALRHQVPIWLHQPPLAMAVQQVTAAHFRHGGEGAYYVYLRRAG